MEAANCCGLAAGLLQLSASVFVWPARRPNVGPSARVSWGQICSTLSAANVRSLASRTMQLQVQVSAKLELNFEHKQGTKNDRQTATNSSQTMGARRSFWPLAHSLSSNNQTPFQTHHLAPILSSILSRPFAHLRSPGATLASSLFASRHSWSTGRRLFLQDLRGRDASSVELLPISVASR